MNGRRTDEAWYAALDALPPVADPVFRDPWWVIGSATMRLLGVHDVTPHDLDLLTSERDAEALFGRDKDLTNARRLEHVRGGEQSLPHGPTRNIQQHS